MLITPTLPVCYIIIKLVGEKLHAVRIREIRCMQKGEWLYYRNRSTNYQLPSKAKVSAYADTFCLNYLGYT
jgi:hypothetical protein